MKSPCFRAGSPGDVTSDASPSSPWRARLAPRGAGLAADGGARALAALGTMQAARGEAKGNRGCSGKQLVPTRFLHVPKTSEYDIYCVLWWSYMILFLNLQLTEDVVDPSQQ